MEAFWHAFRNLKGWQIVVLVVILLGAAGGTYGGYARASGPDRPALGTNQQIIPVKYGNLVNQVSTNGNLAFPNRENLTFGSKGIVAAVLVEEGQRVLQGQVVARLDRTALASLDQVIAQARVDLKNVQETLDEAKKPPALALAQARANVAAAEVSLKEAVKALDDFVPQQGRELAQARQAKAEADLALDKARKTLDDFAPQHGRELAQARQAKAQGLVQVALGAGTVVQRPTRGTVADLLAGVRVTVFGQRSEDGTVVARTVLLVPEGDGGFFR